MTSTSASSRGLSGLTCPLARSPTLRLTFRRCREAICAHRTCRMHTTTRRSSSSPVAWRASPSRPTTLSQASRPSWQTSITSACQRCQAAITPVWTRRGAPLPSTHRRTTTPSPPLAATRPSTFAFVTRRGPCWPCSKASRCRSLQGSTRARSWCRRRSGRCARQARIASARSCLRRRRWGSSGCTSTRRSPRPATDMTFMPTTMTSCCSSWQVSCGCRHPIGAQPSA
mmetsp:Transcript_27272/g.87591  ORF Transcript_27272/g.87591 Transcript_27272/m.87591 type:complete len:228 (+) Transcript_27272:221-904(+)